MSQEPTADKMSSPPVSSPTPVPQLQNRRPGPLTDLIAQSFAPFDHQSAIVGPFSEEANRDIAFEKELSAMLLDVVLEMHAWASRPKHETHIAIAKFEDRISDVMEKEKEQETTRERLNEFVTRMKTALAVLM